MTMLCFTLASHLMSNLCSFFERVSVYQKPPAFELPHIRKELQACLMSSLKPVPQAQSLDAFFLSRLLSTSFTGCTKQKVTTKDLIDAFYRFSHVDARFQQWPHRYTLWTEELLDLLKMFLAEHHEKAQIFFIGHSMISLAEDLPAQSFFVDACCYRWIWSEQRWQVLFQETQFHKLMHAQGLMKAGRGCAVDRWQNLSSRAIATRYRELKENIQQECSSLLMLNHMVSEQANLYRKIERCCEVSYLLTLKKKCRIPVCKAKQKLRM